MENNFLSPIVLPVLFFFFLLLQLAEAASTSESPVLNPTFSNYRSAWSILGTCALTLLICIWNVAYPNVTREKGWYKALLYRGALGLSALLTPEISTTRAYSEWVYAGQIKEEFRGTRNASEYRWTRTHGFFVLMGGFVVHSEGGGRLLKTPEDLHHPTGDGLIHPYAWITKEEINDRSKSDGLGNTLLVLQLSWFILQVVARGANGLAITLVEIGTLTVSHYFFSGGASRWRLNVLMFCTSGP
ncbi:hypothetical protein PAXINDRAFT_87371 [Paxillus involutus ATCC 200175]|uniref:Uncharacterized protein n=1 Tax=Paxillus involutus ATCC 200175 TaxID=664439 RepID=A0A0C9TEV7_PAXIN|nr:hypothetical protein PAXINDRAFT_87371 [Paxillus involutus ATCC 200175]